MRELLIRLINAKYSLSTWLWVFASTAMAVAVVLFSITDPPRIAEFASALPFKGTVWGSILIVGGLTTMIGMASDMKWFVRFGSMASCLMWFFGVISFAQGGVTSVIVFAGPLLILHAYIYLASHVREYPRL